MFDRKSSDNMITQVFSILRIGDRCNGSWHWYNEVGCRLVAGRLGECVNGIIPPMRYGRWRLSLIMMVRGPGELILGYIVMYLRCGR